MCLLEVSFAKLTKPLISFFENYGYYVLFGLLLWHFKLLPKLKEWFPHTIGGEMREERKRELDESKRAAIDKLQNPKNNKETQEKLNTFRSRSHGSGYSAGQRKPTSYNPATFGTKVHSLGTAGTHDFPGVCRSCSG